MMMIMTLLMMMMMMMICLPPKTGDARPILATADTASRTQLAQPSPVAPGNTPTDASPTPLTQTAHAHPPPAKTRRAQARGRGERHVDANSPVYTVSFCSHRIIAFDTSLGPALASVHPPSGVRVSLVGRRGRSSGRVISQGTIPAAYNPRPGVLVSPPQTWGEAWLEWRPALLWGWEEDRYRGRQRPLRRRLHGQHRTHLHIGVCARSIGTARPMLRYPCLGDADGNKWYKTRRDAQPENAV